MTHAIWGARLRAGILLGLTAAVTSCGQVTREGTGSSYLIIETLDVASGAEPSEFGGTLYSDVITVVDDSPTIFSDLARVRFALGMKDPGGTASPTAPTSANFITVDRYRVRFIRADGRNTPGQDVPYAFDGSLTATVGTGGVEVSFEIVRHAAKMEAPLLTLQTSPVIINTIAEVTFYGRDQTGREASAIGRITVDFGNFGDPD